jgi:iron complex outermembrane recepter protein
MNIFKTLFSNRVILSVILMAMVCVAESSAAEFDDFDELDLEALMDIEIEGATKTSLKVSDSPLSVTVITAEDIRRSGAISIPEVLEYVAGVSVLTFSASQQEVNIRGLNAEICPRTKTMLNGVSIYAELFNFTMWDMLPITLDDIERIEVIRGPSSIIYGANAESGAINIVTKDPEQTEELMVSALVGSRNLRTNQGGVRYSGNNSGWSYYLSSGWHNWADWEHPSDDSEPKPDNKSSENWLVNGEVGYRFGPDARLIIRGATTHTDGASYTKSGPFQRQSKYSYGLINLDLGGLTVKSQYNHIEGEVVLVPSMSADFLVNYDPLTGSTLGIPFPEARVEGFGVHNYIDNEIRYTHDILENDRLTVGINYLRNKISFKGFFGGEEYIQDIFAGFMFNELKLDPVAFHLGLRMDAHPVYGEMVSPRASLVYTPSEGYAFRISAGRAFRTASLIETYLDLQTPTVLAIAPEGQPLVPPQYTLSPIYASVYGAEVSDKITGHGSDLKPEQLTSYEIGADIYPTKWLNAKISLFYNQYRDFIDFGVNEEGIGITWGNYGSAEQYGAEIGIETFITTWLKGFANYSYQQTMVDEDNPESYQNEAGRDLSSPEHLANAGLLSTFFDSLTVDVYLHYEGEREFYSDEDFIPAYVTAIDPYYTGDPVTGAQVLTSPDVYGRQGEYAIVNARVGYRLPIESLVEIYAAGRNINNWKYKSVPTPQADMLYARYTGGVTMSF